MWVVFIDATGECWTFQNPEIRLQGPNPSMGRPMPNAKQKNKTNVGKKLGEDTQGLRVGAQYAPKGNSDPGKKVSRFNAGPSNTKGGRSGQSFKK